MFIVSGGECIGSTKIIFTVLPFTYFDFYKKNTITSESGRIWY